MRLAVELYGTSIATLEGESRSYDLIATESGLRRFGANSTVLSVAIPLTPKLRRDQAPRRRNWFAELLPEGDQYDYLLAQAGLRRGDTLAFLARYGRDVAGALQIWDLDDPTEPKTPAVRQVTPEQIRALLEDPIGSPLANDPRSGRSSLGGVQPKIVLVRTSDGWAQALGGHPTTHILKPRLEGSKATVIFDEEYGSRIARRLGLADFATSIEKFDGLPAIVIERYDRVDGDRVHQEDFSQVLGASGNQKYQEYGGVVSLRRIADILKRSTPKSELTRLAQLVTLAVGIGNLDLHTKNLGLLHPTDDDVRLAPAYDVVPQAHLSQDGRLALAVNRKYRHADLTREDLLAEFEGWGLKRAVELVDETLTDLRATVAQETPLDDAFPALQEQLLAFVDNLLHDKPIGAAESTASDHSSQ